jgi:hypothetical protein
MDEFGSWQTPALRPYPKDPPLPAALRDHLVLPRSPSSVTCVVHAAAVPPTAGVYPAHGTRVSLAEMRLVRNVAHPLPEH